MTHPVCDGMRTGEFGRIVNFSSIYGQKEKLEHVNYSAAKDGRLVSQSLWPLRDQESE